MIVMYYARCVWCGCDCMGLNRWLSRGFDVSSLQRYWHCRSRTRRDPSCNNKEAFPRDMRRKTYSSPDQPCSWGHVRRKRPRRWQGPRCNQQPSTTDYSSLTCTPRGKTYFKGGGSGYHSCRSVWSYSPMIDAMGETHNEGAGYVLEVFLVWLTQKQNEVQLCFPLFFSEPHSRKLLTTWLSCWTSGLTSDSAFAQACTKRTTWRQSPFRFRPSLEAAMAYKVEEYVLKTLQEQLAACEVHATIYNPN